VKTFINDWRFVVLISLLLGFAPFFPEPHIFGKMRWIAGGALGMKPIDWFDFFWHAWPFALLIRLGVLAILRKRKTASQ